ncbi:GYF domain-containing protein [Microsporum canis CBS 113480]|uniref:GYF domain-containing protein n=1 Tax=Arthroderma otae (strain ATCC MYA-4605 / CBS 113480) TaxID=554155 RepID=C5FPF2_ARTOC|nr:GYF domain-containing protein [Microsporum canis CBS 113480]EEQ31468.1 GYF domain-containing protein [Microsporum canis CBS 113480]
MSSPLPSTFASAAAGNTQDSASGSRRDVMNSGEWSRNRMNGATQTFRRPSVATNPSHSRENAQQAPSNTSNPSGAAYIPPHLNSNYQSARSGNDSTYSKEQLLNLYKNQRGSKDWGKSISGYFMGDWNPRSERPPTNGSWGKQDDSKDNNAAGPEICWDHKGQSEPLGLMDMNDEEKELFSTSVNSPLKPPPQNANKDGASGGGSLGRKSSISHGHMNAFNSTSPASTRAAPRRRGTGDSGNPLSPTGSRFFREESNTATPPPAILRRKTDIKDSTSDSKWDDNKEKSFAERDPSFDISSPFGSLKRSTTNPVSTGAVGSASPWSSNQGSAFGSMGVGAFGNFALGGVGSQNAMDKKPGFGSVRSESRFKNLLSKTSSEDISGNSKEKPSAIGLDRLPEAEDDVPGDTAEEALKNRPSRSETNPFDERRSGSAALGGQEMGGIDQFGLSSFGMPGGTSALRDLVASSQPPSHTHHEPMSPTHTNPYQSPRGDRNNDNSVGAGDGDNEGSDIQQHARLPNIGDLRDDSAHGPFGSMPRPGMISDIPAADRSQTSSVGANRGFPGLGGLGGLGSLGNSGGWPTSSATGTPTRERPAFGFGDPIFGPMSDLQSPSTSGLGGGGIFGSQTSLSNMGAASRPSKLGSLFPPAMQDQMRNEQSHSNDETGKPQDPFTSLEKPGSLPHPSTTTSHTPTVTSGGTITIPSSQPLLDGNLPNQNAGQFGGSSSNQLPPAQQRQMVMPDRMRWIYRDPQGPPGPQGGAPDFGAGQDELPVLLDRMNVNRGTGQFGFNNSGSFPPGPQDAQTQAHNQAVSTMLQDRSRLQQEQENFNKAHPESIFDQQAREERVRQFHALRIADEDIPVRRTEEPANHREASQEHRPHEQSSASKDQPHFNQGNDQELTLTQKVQNAASAQRLQQQQQQQQFNAQAPSSEVESPWAKVDNGLPQPFPPPPSQSPLPAPAAQRNRQHVADNLAAETRSQTQTPSEVHTTSVAPWAKEHCEAAKGPSLREIQEAEARKAAKLEELAAAARRALAEQERANPPPAPAPGLPSTANWARSGSANTPASDASSAWSKSAGGKNQGVAANTAPKKTLAQIQKEEEARKQRTAAAAAAAASAANPLGAPVGKRYAELAGKMTAQQPTPTASGGAWTTVGAGGKAKAAPVSNAVNSRNVPGLTPSPTPATKPKTIMTRNASMGNSTTAQANRPTEELAKWAKLALEKGLNSSINVDDFVQQLLFLPPESEIISDSVYANSQTLDGRRFAEEFIRRRKLADKGIIDPASSGAFGSPVESKNSSDGWNEVAKKGNAAASREDQATSNAAFKVVSKKKGKR